VAAAIWSRKPGGREDIIFARGNPDSRRNNSRRGCRSDPDGAISVTFHQQMNQSTVSDPTVVLSYLTGALV
jgi:hypothetical protein